MKDNPREVVLHPNATWSDGETTYEVAGYAVDGDTVVVSVWAGGTNFQTMSVNEVIATMIEAKWVTEPLLVERADDDITLASLTDDQYQRVLHLERNLLEVFTGFPTWNPPPGAKPRPDYDPNRTAKDRIAAKSKEIGLGKSAIYDNWRNYQTHGRAALVHANFKPYKNVLDNYDAPLIEFVRGFIVRNKVRSTKQWNKLLARLAAELDEAGIERESEWRLNQLLTELSRGQSLGGDAVTRRTKDNRPVTGSLRSIPSAYGEVMEVDATPCDFFVWSPGGREYLSVWAIFITCIATKITRVRLTTSPPNSRSFALTLAQLLAPPIIETDGRPPELAAVLPKFVDIDPTQWADMTLPLTTAGQIDMDHGTEGENGHIMQLAAQARFTIVFSRPRSPTNKPHIEATIKTMNLFSQLFDGHKGSNVRKRGDKPERELLLTFDAAQAAMSEFCLQEMFKPHTGLRHPADPRRLLTPMQAFATSLLAGLPLRASADPNLVFQFLPHHWAAVTGRGPTIDNIVYTCEEIETLRQLSAGDRRTKSRPLLFHRDPNDLSRIFWHEPGTARWHTLRGIYQGSTIPAFSELTYPKLIAEMPHTRFTKQQQLDWDTAFRRWIDRMAKSKTGRNELQREFARVYEAVPDPLPRPPRPTARDGASRTEPEPLDWPTPAATDLPDVSGVRFDGDPPDDDDHEGWVIDDDDWLDE